MAETIATEEVVFAAANALRALGQKPSIKLIQQKTGGSYTTVKRHLDAWTLKQDRDAQEAFAAPEAVLDMGNELARSLWALARSESQKEVQQAKDQAQTEIAGLAQELEFAQVAIGRMEEAEQAHSIALAQCNSQLQDTQRLLEEARIVAARVPDLETRLSTVMGVNDELHQAANAASHANGLLAGEAASLRQRVQELTEALVTLKSPSPLPHLKDMPMSNPLTRRVDADEFAHCTDDAVVVLEISRREIEGGDFGSALERLHVLADTRENALRYRESLFLMVTGYDQDPRELCEIPDVRTYFARLCDQWPHWLWYLSRSLGMIPLLMSLRCSVRVVRREGAAGTQFKDVGELESLFDSLWARTVPLFESMEIEAEQAREAYESAWTSLHS